MIALRKTFKDVPNEIDIFEIWQDGHPTTATASIQRMRNYDNKYFIQSDDMAEYHDDADSYKEAVTKLTKKARQYFGD